MPSFEAMVARDSSTYTTITIEAKDGDEALEKALTYLRKFEAEGVDVKSISEGDECFNDRVCELTDEVGETIHEDVELVQSDDDLKDQALDLLIAAYKTGFVRGGSMDWSEVDAAYAAAVAARHTTVERLEQAWTEEGEATDG